MLEKIKNNKPLKIIGNIIYVVSFIVVLLVLLVVLIQRFSNNEFSIAGIRVFNVATGSMIPKYNVGDILILKEVDPSQINVGDDIAYLGDEGSFRNKVVTHQVIEKKENNGEYSFITQGIANNTPDPEITADQVYGKVIYKSIILSFISGITKNLYMFYFLIIVPIAIIIAKMIIDMLIRKEEEKEEAESKKNKAESEDEIKEKNSKKKQS